MLDAGSGAGYGSHYLALHGASEVVGLDSDVTAVEFSKRYFNRPNLKFEQIDLLAVTAHKPESFDVVFCSNVLEHVADVRAVLCQMVRILKPEGIMIVAVPPIVDECSKQENVTNPYHLNIWSPRQWYFVLAQYFEEIHCYTHLARPGIPLDFPNTPRTATITEEDFDFDRVSLDELGYKRPTLTGLFVASKPNPVDRVSAFKYSMAFVDDSFTKSFRDAD